MLSTILPSINFTTIQGARISRRADLIRGTYQEAGRDPKVDGCEVLVAGEPSILVQTTPEQINMALAQSIHWVATREMEEAMRIEQQRQQGIALPRINGIG
jgi:hypothetical protein